MTESRIKEYKDSELEQLFKQVEKTLTTDKRLKEAVDEQYYILRTGGSIGTSDTALGPYSHDDAIEKAKRYRKFLTPGEKEYYNIKYKVISKTEYDRMVRQGRLKEAEEDSLEQKINDWVTSTIDDWRSSWDDSREGAESAKYDLETAVDWFLNNLDQFEENYGYALDTEDEALVADIAQSYAEETLDDLRSSWDHFEDSDYDSDEDDSEDDEDEDFEDEESWDESLAVTRSKIREYKHSNLEQLFNKIDNTLKEADTYLVFKGYTQFNEGTVEQDAASNSQGKAIQAGMAALGQGQAELAQTQANDTAAMTDMINGVEQKTAQNTEDIKAVFDSVAENEQKINQLKADTSQSIEQKSAELKNLLQTINQDNQEAMSQLQTATAEDKAKLQKGIRNLQNQLKQVQNLLKNPEQIQGSTLSQQDAKLAQGTLMKQLTNGDIAKKLDQILPKVSPTFKGDHFQITKVEPMAMDQNDPNSLKFKVSFNLVSGSKKADRMLASQDPTIDHARQFLNSLQEEQLNETIMGAIGNAAGKAVNAVKQGFQNVVAGFSNAKGSNTSVENVQMATTKEPMLQQYLPKLIDQVFADNLTINGKQFQLTVPKVSLKKDSNALKNAQATVEQAQAEKDAAKASKNADKQAKKAQAAVDKQAKKDAKAAEKAENEKIKTAQAQQAMFGNDLEKNLDESQTFKADKLTEGSVVKGGTFILDLTLAGAAEKPQAATQPQQTQAQAQTQQPAQQQAAQPAQQATAQQQTAQQPAGQSINIYNNGYPQQGQPGQPGQPQQRVQNTGIPDWKNLSRGQKKFLRKANKAAKTAGKAGRTPRNGNFENNIWDLTYGNGGKYGSNWA